MKATNLQALRLCAGSILLASISTANASTLNNTVIVVDSMTWDRDLSVASSTYMPNMDGSFTYMGMDSVSMMGDPVWDYSWSLTADPDPFIAGSFTVTNTSAMMQTFDITFALPVSPTFTNGYMTGSLSGSYTDADSSGGATLNLNDWDGLIGTSSEMNLFSFAGPCFGIDCSVTIDEVFQGPTLYTGAVDSTIGIHMNFALSAGDRVTFDTRFEVTPVPVPAAAWLFGSGLLGLIGVARRKKAA